MNKTYQLIDSIGRVFAAFGKESIPLYVSKAIKNGNVNIDMACEPCFNRDSDGDGMSDCSEIVGGSDFSDPDSNAWDDFKGDAAACDQQSGDAAACDRVSNSPLWNIDSDGDGFSDGWELGGSNTDPGDPYDYPPCTTSGGVTVCTSGDKEPPWYPYPEEEEPPPGGGGEPGGGNEPGGGGEPGGGNEPGGGGEPGGGQEPGGGDGPGGDGEPGEGKDYSGVLGDIESDLDRIAGKIDKIIDGMEGDAGFDFGDGGATWSGVEDWVKPEPTEGMASTITPDELDGMQDGIAGAVEGMGLDPSGLDSYSARNFSRTFRLPVGGFGTNLKWESYKFGLSDFEVSGVPSTIGRMGRSIRDVVNLIMKALASLCFLVRVGRLIWR